MHLEHGYFSDLEYTDVKVENLRFPEANPGNVVGFEYVRHNRPHVFEDQWVFQHRVPVVTARYDLQLSPGWEFTARWFNHPEQKPQTPAPNEFVWEVNNLPAMEIEPDMPNWRVVIGWIGMKYFPQDPSLRAKSSGSWKDVGLWYEGPDESGAYRLARNSTESRGADRRPFGPARQGARAHRVHAAEHPL